MAVNARLVLKSGSSRYSGKWVAIRNQKVIASNEDAGKAFLEAKRKSYEQKFVLARVPEKNQAMIL